MKKALVLLAATLAATAAMAQTNQVLSRNAVGYERFTVATSQFAMVRLDFVDLNGGVYTVTNLIGNQLPNGSSVYLWDSSSQSYILESKGRSGWLPGTNVVQRGAGLWMTVPAGAVSNQYDVYFMGEVPDSITAPTTTVTSLPGFSLLGFGYPVATTWTNQTIAQGAPNGSSLYVWDQPTQNYVLYTKNRSGWSTPANFTIQPGQGFWYQQSSLTQTWAQVKPYTWP